MYFKPGALIEPVLEDLRINKVVQYLPKNGVLIDIGCDMPPILINKVSSMMKKCIGLDIVMKESKYGNVELYQQNLQKKIKLSSNIGDAVTMLAVLEHMKFPQEMANEAFRILKKGGVWLVTVPSPQSKGLLEIFGKVGLVREEMILQHENYFSLERLRNIAIKAGFSKVHVEHWELGYNTFLCATK